MTSFCYKGYDTFIYSPLYVGVLEYLISNNWIYSETNPDYVIYGEDTSIYKYDTYEKEILPNTIIKLTTNTQTNGLIINIVDDYYNIPTIFKNNNIVVSGDMPIPKYEIDNKMRICIQAGSENITSLYDLCNHNIIISKSISNLTNIQSITSNDIILCGDDVGRWTDGINDFKTILNNMDPLKYYWIVEMSPETFLTYSDDILKTNTNLTINIKCMGFDNTKYDESFDMELFLNQCKKCIEKGIRLIGFIVIGYDGQTEQQFINDINTSKLIFTKVILVEFNIDRHKEICTYIHNNLTLLNSFDVKIALRLNYVYDKYEVINLLHKEIPSNIYQWIEKKELT